jgi:hypothetical protein
MSNDAKHNTKAKFNTVLGSKPSLRFSATKENLGFQKKVYSPSVKTGGMSPACSSVVKTSPISPVSKFAKTSVLKLSQLSNSKATANIKKSVIYK